MKRIQTIAAMRAAARALHSSDARIAFVPTMGALHEGHLRLIERARSHADTVVLSVFVNPLQFGPTEDFSSYPRDLERDAALAGSRGADLLFAPTVEEMYPEGESKVIVTAPAMAQHLCGRYRPGHFNGVLTVVARLFNIVTPDVAVFGQKDYQQAVLIRRMVRDLGFPVRVEVAPIVREADGLAMSSRNAYLSEEERRRAVALSRGLRSAAQQFDAGERSAAVLMRTVRDVLDSEGGIQVQYVELVEPETLESLQTAEEGSVIAVATFVGATRLIDNLILGSRLEAEQSA